MHLFQSKRRKIEAYLNEKQQNRSPFDLLLAEYLSGTLTTRLTELGVTRISFHVDWLEDYRCLEIAGQYRDGMLDVQMEEQMFSISFDADEPDDAATYPLTTPEAVFDAIRNL